MSRKSSDGFPKPRVVVSKCLGFEACRYNGEVIPNQFLDHLQEHVEVVAVCPEVEIGLGTPRPTIRLVRKDNDLRLVQPDTGEDVTEAMRTFSERFLDDLGEVDGFVFKSRSPSCGLKDAKIYPSESKGPSLGKSSGLFAEAVLRRHPTLAIEDEARLTNQVIREHFLTKIFALAAWRRARTVGTMGELVRFQATHKLLLMAYNQRRMRILGRIVANPEKRRIGEVLDRYEEDFHLALETNARYTSHINVLQHAFGYFKEELTPQEKKYFLDTIETYRKGRIPLSVPVGILRSWIVRFETAYLMDQVYFSPYPEELIITKDSGKGRIR